MHGRQHSHPRLTMLLLVGIVVFSLGALSPVRPARAANVTISPAWGSLPAAVYGAPWSADFSASGGTSGYVWSMTGAIPGLSLNASTGRLSGTPTQGGTFSVTLDVVDKDGNTGSSSTNFVVGRVDTTTTIVSVTSAHPSGQFMVGFAALVSVRVTNAGGFIPTGSVVVSSGGGGPTCTVTLDAAGEGECGLFFQTAGSKTLSAAYQQSDSFNASTSANYGPITVIALSLTRSLSAGLNHTCLLDASGMFTCWGLGDNYPTDAGGNPVSTGPVTAVSSGGYHTCALRVDGTAECWGVDPLIREVPAHKLVSIGAGMEYACGLDTKGDLYCWGALPAGIAAQPAGKYKALSAGQEHVCAIRRSDSKPICWGSASGTPPDTAVTALAAGNTHTCAIKSDGALACWGAALSQAVPAKPVGVTFDQIGSGSAYSCVLRSDNRIDCWGAGWGASYPAVDEAGTYSTLSAGFLHTCAATTGATPYLGCWGQNTYGQAPRLSLGPATLPAYLPQNQPWSQVFTAEGGTPAYTFTRPSGAFPAGLALSGATLSGSPSTVGAYTFTVQASENFAASSLPLELKPAGLSYMVTVEDPSTTIAITTPAVDTTSTEAGMPVLVKVQVTDSATPVLDGYVTIGGGDAGASCTVQVQPDGKAECALFFAASGSKTISATYDGDAFHLASAAATRAVTITAPVITPSVSIGNGFGCTVDASGAVHCWGKNESYQANPPGGFLAYQISAGDAHTCARGVDSKIYCWGWNGFNTATPPGYYGFTSVTSGVSHTCGLFWDGSVRCWGNAANSRTSPPAGVYTSVSAGDEHTCALNSGGSAVCWGKSTEGRTSPPGGSTYTALSSGGSFSCGLKATGEVECWGGTGIVDSIRTEPAGPFQSLDAGYKHACAIKTDGTLACWGDNTSGQTAPPAGTFISLSAGRYQTCAIRTDGYLKCWGAGLGGQVFALTLSPDASHTQLPFAQVNQAWSQSFTAAGSRTGTYQFSLSAGALPPGLTLNTTSGLLSGAPTQAGLYNFTIRVIETGLTPALIEERAYSLTVKSRVAISVSASPTDPMVGDPVTVSVTVAETPGSFMGASPTGAVDLDLSDGQSCQPSLTGGSASCTFIFSKSGAITITAAYPGDDRFLGGDNQAGPFSLNVDPFARDLAIVTGSDRTIIHKADGTAICRGTGCSDYSLSGFNQVIGAGEGWACKLATDGSVKCKANGQAEVVHAGPYVDLAVGSAHACAIKVDGTVECWGENGSGQAAPPAGVFTALSAGPTHTCGIKNDGTLACWGANSAGQSTPPPGTFTQVRLGGSHTCAIRTDGTLICWGDNTYGQLNALPGTYTSLGLGTAHTCAVRTDGRIACWGDDRAGQAAAPSGSDFVTLSAYADHTCALRQGLTLTCWGTNANDEAPQITYEPLVDDSLVAKQPWEHFFKPVGTTPFTGAVSEGALPDWADIRFSEGGVVLYGTPVTPGVYDFTLRWEDSSVPLHLVTEQPYHLTVTGAELSVDIKAAHEAALPDNAFRFDYTVANSGALAVPSTRLTVEIPGALNDLSLSGLSGCALKDHTVTCSIGSIPAGGSLALSVTGTLDRYPDGKDITTSARIVSLLPEWPELSPTDNTRTKTVPVVYNLTVLDDGDFADPGASGWSAGSPQTSPGGVTYLGDFDGASAPVLSLTDLAPHRRITIAFDLYVIGPWDGNAGPSTWSFGLDGLPPLLTTTFCNGDDCTQTYPGAHPGGNYPGGTGAEGQDELGDPNLDDARYHFSVTLPHTGGTLALAFSAANLPPDAVWGIDNVRVQVESGMEFAYLPVVKR